MKVGIIGLGFVGSAMLESFQIKNVDVIGYDKYKNGGINTLDNVLDTDIVFLCLPTKFDTTINKYDKEPIHSVCAELVIKEYEGVVVIKSTVEPETTEQLSEKYDLSFVHNPEFLTARTAFQDFHNQTHIVLGQSSNCTDHQLDILTDFYKFLYPNAMISASSATESESMKIFVNCFYAVKIQFFNELYLTCQKTGANYDIVKDLMLKNDWIHPMHTDVPGPDGKLSYGGLCFPKDTNALKQFMKEKTVSNGVLDAVIKERNEMRDDHDNIQ